MTVKLTENGFDASCQVLHKEEIKKEFRRFRNELCDEEKDTTEEMRAMVLAEKRWADSSVKNTWVAHEWRIWVAFVDVTDILEEKIVTPCIYWQQLVSEWHGWFDRHTLWMFNYRYTLQRQVTSNCHKPPVKRGHPHPPRTKGRSALWTKRNVLKSSATTAKGG